MRLLLQRVTRAEVRVVDCALTADAAAADSAPGAVVGRIGRGLLVLVGVAPADGPTEVAWATTRLLGLRVFADAAGKMNLDLRAVGGELLLVSQFTLYADLGGGRRPGFSRAASPADAARVYDALAASLRAEGVALATGAFGRAMHVELVNDGPVTLWLDSAER